MLLGTTLSLLNAVQVLAVQSRHHFPGGDTIAGAVQLTIKMMCNAW